MDTAKVIRKSYKFRIYPSKAQTAKFEQTLDLCRELYNAALQERRDAWRLNKVSINYFDQNKQLPEIRKIREDIKSVNSHVSQDILRRVDKTFKSFFARIKRKEKIGFPRFKSASRFNSFTFTHLRNGWKFEDNNLHLSRIGKVKIKLSREIEGAIKTLTIKRENNKWYALFTCDNVPINPLPKTNKQIGIDVGIENFATLSNGIQIENSRFFEKTQKQLRRANRKVSRRKKFSNRWRKAVKQVAKIHSKIRNQRNDFQHKLSTSLVKEFDLIAVEKLNIKGLSKGCLSKQINDAAWYSFTEKLTYKAENADKQVIKVNPNGTSQTCICGRTVKKALALRWHLCEICGLSEHRDIVSAKVILQRAGFALQAQTETVRLKVA